MRRQPQDLRPAGPIHVLLPEQAQIRLVYQRCGLQGVVQPLPRQAGFGDAMQFGIQSRHHRVQRSLVAGPNAGKRSLEIRGIAHPFLIGSDCNP